MKEAPELAERAEATGIVADLLQIRWAHVRVLVARGRAEEAGPIADWLVEAAGSSGGAEDLTGGFPTAAQTYLALGDPDRAIELLEAVDRSPRVRETPTYSAYLAQMLRTALAAGDVSLAERLTVGLEDVFPAHEHAR